MTASHVICGVFGCLEIDVVNGQEKWQHGTRLLRGDDYMWDMINISFSKYQTIIITYWLTHVWYDMIWYDMIWFIMIW